MQRADDAEEIDTTELEIDEVVARSRRSSAPARSSANDHVRRPRLVHLARWLAPMRRRQHALAGTARADPDDRWVRGCDQPPAWIDIPIVGALSPRNLN